VLYPAGSTPAPGDRPGWTRKLCHGRLISAEWWLTFIARGVDEPGSPEGVGLGEFVCRACTKVQAENRPPARCISPLSVL
jgi:hypothetical protein